MVATRRSTAKKPGGSPRDVPVNSRSITCRVPVEILSEILLHLVEAYPLTKRNAPLKLVTSICQWWRNTALSFPKLWTAIVLDSSRKAYDANYKPVTAHPKHRIQTFLQRSRNLPLDIMYEVHYASKSASHMYHFETLIAPHLTRCCTLYIRLNTLEQLRRVTPLPKGLEKLRSFNLEISTQFPSSPLLSPPVTLFQPDNGVRLRHLRVTSSYIPFYLDNIAPQELESFTYSPPRGYPSTDHAVKWLRNATLLKECVIAESRTPSRPPSDLPALELMRINCADPSMIFRASSLVRLDWTLPDSGIPDDVDLSQAGQHLPNLRHLSVASLELGEFNQLLPFLRGVPSVVNLQIHHWVWDDVISLVRALATEVSGPDAGETSSSSLRDSTPVTPSQFNTDLLPSLQCFFMNNVRNIGPLRVAITHASFDKLLKRDQTEMALNNLLIARPTLANWILNMGLNGDEVEKSDVVEMQREYALLDRRVAEMSPHRWNQFDWDLDLDRYLSD